MCGITGILHTDANVIDYARLKVMTDIVAHRGPDGEGHWIADNGLVGFGHRRLSIIDLSSDGHQPMHYANKRYTITFNGEIYNYVELRTLLINKGYSFKSNSDTEVLLALYAAEKENCLSFLDGMFAFAIWDNQEQSIFFARDRFGEKPMHYAYVPGKYFVFGSEIKSLWAFGIPKTVNQKMLYRYLIYDNVMNAAAPSETFYEGVYRVSPGYYGKIFASDLKLRFMKYWDINYSEISYGITETEAENTFRELFLRSVQRRLRSDVALGSSLSGGLDSSLVVCAIDNLKGHDQSYATFSARFPGFNRDEGEYMQYVIDSANVVPYFVYPNEKDMISSLDKLCFHQEEPFGSSSIFVQYEVMKLAKEKGVTVLMDGQGADEILAGYHSYFYSYFEELRKSNYDSYRMQVQKYRSLHKDNDVNGRIYNPGTFSWLKDQVPYFLTDTAKSFRISRQQRKSPFLNRDFYNSFREEKSDLKKQDTLNADLYKSTMGKDLEVLLRYADRNSMAHSREVRLPFLSHELVEFLFKLPAKFKIKDGWTKYIMRSAFKDMLPPKIAWRKDKIGYEPPQQKWLSQDFVKDIVYDYKQKLIREKILDLSILNDNSSKMCDHYGLYDGNWKILMLGKIL